MSPHQIAEEIVLWHANLFKNTAFIGEMTEDVCDAIQAASNAEVTRRRERVASLEAALRDQPCRCKLERCVAEMSAQALESGAIEEVTYCSRCLGLSGSTSALDAVVAEAVAKVTEERDAARLERDQMAAAIDGSKNCPKCHGFGYVDDGKSRTYYETDTAAEADLTDMWHRVKCSCRKVDPVAALAARDSRIKAEGAALEMNLWSERWHNGEFGDEAITAQDFDKRAKELRKLASQAGEVAGESN